MPPSMPIPSTNGNTIILAGFNGMSSSPISPKVCNKPTPIGSAASRLWPSRRKSNTTTGMMASNAYQAAFSKLRFMCREAS